MRPHTLSTPRLFLVPITLNALLAEAAGNYGIFSDYLEAGLTHEWPPADWEPHVLELLESAIKADPETSLDHRYILLKGDKALTLIGCLGGFRWPHKPGEIEIGYSILPSFRRQGYATEAVFAYLELLKSRSPGLRIMAHTFPHLTASVRILETCGFQHTGNGVEEGTVRYELVSI